MDLVDINDNEKNELMNEYNLLYLNKKYVSDKQKEFILKLYTQIEKDDDKELFKERIDQFDQYGKSEIYKLINDLKKVVPAALQIMFIIYKKFNTNDIFKLLKKEKINQSYMNKKYLKLTQYEAELLLKPPDKFSLWIKEHPILSEDEWEFGYQESTLFNDNKMYYLKFYNMMMLDFDNFTLDELLDHLKQFDKFRFRIYQSYGGFHVFIISRMIPYNHPLSSELAKEMLSDIYYNMFSYKTGYKIRLSKKIGRNEIFVSKYIMDYGDIKKSVHPLCAQLIKIHDYFLNL